LEWELDRDEEHISTAQIDSASGAKIGARFEEAQVLSWLSQLSWGLQHLHARKFLHRDLKPQNVLLTHGGRRALLADFGVAGKVEHTEDLKHSIVGTPAFMSPEMLEGRPYGIKTDQWALGCVLYEMMALEPPFANCGESYAAVVGAVLHAPPMAAPPGYSRPMSDAMQALLARKPHARPSNRELLRGVLRAPFHAFVQSLEQAAAATTQAERVASTAATGTGAAPSSQHPQSHSYSHSHSQTRSSSTVSTVPTTALPTARAGDGVASSLAPSEFGSPSRKSGAKGVGICGLPALETDVVSSYASDFESMTDSPSASAHNIAHETSPDPNGNSMSPATALLYGCGGGDELGCLSLNSDLSETSGSHEGSAGGLGGVGLAAGEWRQLLAEAEALLQPPLEEETSVQEEACAEAEKLRASLCTTLGGVAQVRKAMGFLRERRPLGDTAEADELLLQVELLDILGDEGLHALPHLERLVALEAMVASVHPNSVQSDHGLALDADFSQTGTEPPGMNIFGAGFGTLDIVQFEAAVASPTQCPPNWQEYLVEPTEGNSSLKLGAITCDLEDVMAAFSPIGLPPSRSQAAPPLGVPTPGYSMMPCPPASPELLN
jgi:serine/threonine protein kinase